MEAFSDEEFYEARDDISSLSGSESPDEEVSEIEKQGSRLERSKPPRHNQPSPHWFSESRFSVWQDGPKSIQERRRLLYERFGLFGRRDEATTDGEDRSRASSQEGSHGRSQIRVARFGIAEHVSSSKKGIWKGSSSPANDGACDFSFKSGKGSMFVGGLETVHRRNSGESSKILTEVEPLALSRSRSDSSAILTDSKIVNAGMSTKNELVRSAGASPQHVVGIERLTQTSGAVLREGKVGPSSSKPPIGSRATVVSKSAPEYLHHLPAHLEKNSDGNRSLVPGRRGAPSDMASGFSAAVLKHVGLISEMENPSVYQSEASAVASVFDSLKWQLSSDSFGELAGVVQNMVLATDSNQVGSSSFDEINDIMCKIKDLDSGKEFIIDELGADGDPKLRELDTGKELTLDEFENSLGLSPVMQEVRRREREKENLDEDDVIQGHDSTAASNNKKKKKSLWVRTMKGVAKTVGGGSKSKLHQNFKVQKEGSRAAESGGEELEGSLDKGIHKEGSTEKGRKIQCIKSKGLSSDALDGLRPRSPQPVKTQAYKKNYRDLSDLNMVQEIQAHQGAIWTMKFSFDGRYLASAGQDRVVQVWEIVDHPFPNAQLGRDGMPESVGVKSDKAGVATPENSQHSQEGSQARRGLRGSVGKRKSAKSNSAGKLPKLFWLCETPVCSFKGHTEDVLDLSWSRSQFLLSSSMDKTVRLWHISYGECLRVFTHNDYVTCIEFSPTDDRYFLSGSLDDKVRIWNIPDHQVVDWSDVREMVTAASYSPDGKRAVIGTYKGTCRFYKTTGHKLQLDGQIDVKNAQGKKSRGKKITGLQFVPGESNRVLITSNDSRVRVYDGLDLSRKFKGLRNVNSQISATFNRNGEYIISASEDSRVYIWNSGLQDFRGSRKDKPQSHEHFPSRNVSIAVSWPGTDPQPPSGVPKEEQSELDTISSRQSANDGLLGSPLRCSPCSSSSSRSNASSRSESGLTSESVGECKSEQSISYTVRNGSTRELADEEVTSRRSDANGSYVGLYHKPETPYHNSFRESPGKDYGIQPPACSPALSISIDSSPLEQSSFRGPSPSFLTDVTPKSSATWPEEKLPSLQDSVKSQAGSWSASSPSQEILSTELSPEGSTAGDTGLVTEASWGLVIVTASLSGEIHSFQNYGYPIRL